MKSVCVSAAFLLFILVEAGPLDEHGGLKHGALGKNPTEHDLKAFLATKPNLWKVKISGKGMAGVSFLRS